MPDQETPFSEEHLQAVVANFPDGFAKRLEDLHKHVGSTDQFKRWLHDFAAALGSPKHRIDAMVAAAEWHMANKGKHHAHKPADVAHTKPHG